MPYNSLIDRTDASALVPEEVTQEIFQGVCEESACLRMFTKLPNMSRKQLRMPVISVLPTAYFVDGDTGLKQTTEAAWEDKYINAEEIAAIIPIPEAVVDDADYDIWGQIKPKLVEAFGAVIDSAILFGIDKPSAWPTDVVASATTAGNVVTLGTGTDLYEDLLGESGAISKLEQDGFIATGHIAHLSMRSKLRSLRDTDGQPLFKATMQEATPYSLEGEPINFPLNGSFDATKALLISGQMDQAVYSIRQDLTFKILDQAVITDDSNNIVYNLAQQDMLALRAVMRIGWQVPNPVNRVAQANRYPFAVLKPSV